MAAVCIGGLELTTRQQGKLAETLGLLVPGVREYVQMESPPTIVRSARSFEDAATLGWQGATMPRTPVRRFQELLTETRDRRSGRMLDLPRGSPGGGGAASGSG